MQTQPGGEVRAGSAGSFCLTQHCLCPVRTRPSTAQLPTSAPPACVAQSPALDSWVHRLPGSGPPAAVPAAPGSSAAQRAAAPPAAAAPRPAACFLGGEREEEDGRSLWGTGGSWSIRGQEGEDRAK